MNRLLLILILPLGFASLAFAADPPPPNAPAEPADMKSIFNGKDLTGWTGDTKLWSAKDGTIRGESTKENPCKSNTFLIYTGNGDQPAAQGFRAPPFVPNPWRKQRCAVPLQALGEPQGQ